ncbi:MAG: STAS/SEC14 domain-containing protein [Weeksellaceae bacterium]|nr:STAS/SEC14 domain-containing protein [Weeksellaceae bacterium]
MIKKIDTEYPNIVAFQFEGEVDKNDFDHVVIPAVEQQVREIDEINLIFILETSISNFTAGAWWKDAMLGLNNITKWNRSAIVTDSEAIQNFTKVFSVVMPGEFKGFDKDNYKYATDWAAGE